jgi:hypothetical protein
VHRGDEGPPRRQQGAGEVEEVQEIRPARGSDDLLGGDSPRPRVETRAPEAEVLDLDPPRAYRLRAGSCRQEREPKVRELAARLVERPRQRPRIARDPGVAARDQPDEPD